MRKISWIPKALKEAKEKGVAYPAKAVQIDCLDELLTVLHYGTMILRLNTEEKEIVCSGGYSKTDARYINNFLDYYGMYHDDLRCARIIDGEFCVYDQMPTIWSAEKIKEVMENLEAKILSDLMDGCGDETREFNVSFGEIGMYVSPTHVLFIDGRSELRWAQSEVDEFEDEFDNYKVKNYTDFLSKDEYSRFIWTSILQDASQSLNEGFFYSLGQCKRMLEKVEAK